MYCWNDDSVVLSSPTPLLPAPPPSMSIGINCTVSVKFLTALSISDEEGGS